MSTRATLLLPILVLALAGCAAAPAALVSPPPTTPIATAPVTPPPTPPVTGETIVTPPPGPSATPRATARPSPMPTLGPAAFVNGVPVETFIVLPPEALENVRRIFARGQGLGRDPHAFSKLGDSVSSVSYYFANFDWGRYQLGVYERLQPAIDFYAGSFARTSLAARVGAHAWAVFTPGQADPTECASDEHMAACEFRVHNPSVALIRLGTNDTAPGDDYERAMRFAIDYCAAKGVIPVLVTKSDRFEGDNRHNETLRQLAAEYAVPLWDFDLAAAALPNRGLGHDNVHLTVGPDDDFTNPETLTFGYGLSDLTGLMMLDAIRELMEDEE
jgi:hypothetical protein